MQDNYQPKWENMCERLSKMLDNISLSTTQVQFESLAEFVWSVSAMSDDTTARYECRTCGERSTMDPPDCPRGVVNCDIIEIE